MPRKKTIESGRLATDTNEIAKKPKMQPIENYEARKELANYDPANVAALIDTDTEIAANVARLLAQPSANFKNEVTDDVIEERTEEFFKWCLDTGTLPTMERYALAIGTTRETIRRWRNGIGCSDDRKYMMQKVVEMMAAFDAEMVIKGKTPVVSYIWRSKNYYDMSDEKRIIIDSNIEKVQSAESLIAEARNLAGDFIDGEYSEVEDD